ncbi:MAG: hypothetical protein JW827_08515 [Spirochaetes bacterium]|nr:hypothetical protein [Spirochaetota bacterium]
MIKRNLIFILFLFMFFQSPLPGQITDTEEASETSVQATSDVKDLEDFEYENPSKYYSINLYDRSDLRLYSTRDSFEGQYSMKMIYDLSSDNLWGTKVIAERVFETPQDVGDFVKGSIMVKGDGSLNVLMVQMEDTDGELYTFQSTTALEVSSWNEVTFSRYELLLDESSVRKDGKLGSKVKGLRIVIANPFTESVSGTVYVDRIRLFYSQEQFRKRITERKSSLKASERIFKNSYVDLEYRNINRYRAPGTPAYAPEFSRGDQLWFWFYLNTEYKFKYFLVTGLIGFQARDFSYSNDRWGRYDLFGQDLKLIIDTSEFIQYTYALTVGQLNPSYHRFLFYNDHQYWWEGAQLNGKLIGSQGYDKTGYDLFYIKGWNDSFAIGLKNWYTIWDAKLTLSGVFSKDNALLQKNEYVFESKNVMSDNAGIIELTRGFNLTKDGGFAVLWLTYGHHSYRRNGKVYLDDGKGNLSVVSNEYQILGEETDLTSLAYNKDSEGNPLYEELDKAVKKESDLYHIRMRLKDLPFKNMEENIQLNWVGPYFKPKFSYRPVLVSEKSIEFGILYNLNPWSSYKNWNFGVNSKLGESTLPRTDPFYFSNLRTIEWNLGKYIGNIGINLKQTHLWQQNPSHPDERLNSYWLYNYLILSLKFSPRTVANLTLSDVNKELYETGKSDINYYATKFNFNFKVYFTQESLLQFEYIKTTPPDTELYTNTWELDNLIKVLLHIDFKF